LNQGVSGRFIMIKKIIFGCMLSTFILLMIPTISAIEYNNVIDENKLNIINEIETLDFEDFIALDFEDFIDELRNINKKQLSNDFLNGIKNVINDLNTKFLNDPEQPLIFPILGIIFYGLIAIIILSVLFSIFSSTFTVIKLILGLIIGTFTGFLGSIWNLVIIGADIVNTVLILIVTIIISIISGSFEILADIGSFIVTILDNLNNFISRIANQMWEKYVTILGLILDILKLIYNTIFNPGSIIG
jgi:hypothetical protein